MLFKDRVDAGRQLAGKLRNFQNEQGVILAIPRGGVPVGYEVSKELGWPMDLMLTKKLGHPKHKEYAIGAVGINDRIIIPHSDVTDDYVESETDAVRKRLKEMRQKFMGDKLPEAVKDKTAIIVDDGIATGNTLLASVEILRKQQPAKIVVAVPVASSKAAKKLAHKADEIVVVTVPDMFYGVGQFYEDFTQVSDEEVIKDLKKM